VIERSKVEEALKEARTRRDEYVELGGKDTDYLDGKVAALEELLAA